MKRTQLKRKTPLKSKNILQASKLPPKIPKRAKRSPKRLKDGSLAKSEKIRILKKKLWSTFSQYIRKSYANHNGYLTTCDGVVVHWKECDCGHLRHNTERNALLGGNELWYYENNFAPQSNQGNRNNADDSAQKYTIWATKKYGLEEIERMFKMRNTYKLWTFEELEEKYIYYSEKLKSL